MPGKAAPLSSREMDRLLDQVVTGLGQPNAFPVAAGKPGLDQCRADRGQRLALGELGGALKVAIINRKTVNCASVNYGVGAWPR